MYKTKGFMKVFNGEKFKTVNYRQEKGFVTFTTSRNSQKYKEMTSSGKIKVSLNHHITTHEVVLIEEERIVDHLFKELKRNKTILFFIPRKDKIIVQYNSNDHYK